MVSNVFVTMSIVLRSMSSCLCLKKHVEFSCGLEDRISLNKS